MVSSTPVLPRKHAPKVLSLVGRKGELDFPFAFLLVFKLNNLKIYTDLFWFLRDGSVQWSRPFFPGVQRSIPCPGPFSSWALRLQRPLPSGITHLRGSVLSPCCVLRWKLAGQTLPHFFFFPFIFNLCHQTQLSHGILLVIVNTVLYLFSQHYGALTICQALGFKRSEAQFLFCWNLVLLIQTS